MSTLPAIAARTAAALATMDTAALRAELGRALTITAQTLAYLAEIWRELEARGEDLSDLRAGLGQYLPLIASGHLEAEAVVRFAGRPTTLRAIATLPIETQRRVAAGDAVTIVTIDADGAIAETVMPAAAMTASQVRQVFDFGRLRGAAEQRIMISSARTTGRRRAARAASMVRVDMSGRVVSIGGRGAPLATVLLALSEAGAIPADTPAGDEAPLDDPVPVHRRAIDWPRRLGEALAAGENVSALARRLRVSPATIYAASRRFGIAVTAARRRDWDAEMEVARQRGETITQTARRLGVSKQRIHQVAKTRR